MSSEETEDLQTMKNPEENNSDPFDDDDFDEFCGNINEENIEDDQALASANANASMTVSQKARSDRNKIKAVMLKQARLKIHPYADNSVRSVTGEKLKKVKDKKLVDGGGGFFIEEDSDEEETPSKMVETPAPIMPPDQPNCRVCKQDFSDSWLFQSFELDVCDKCRDTEKDGEHELITKTEAKNCFVMKDSDFEEGQRGKAMKFILRKNPHNPRWGDMKLFLRLQVEERAKDIWKTEEALEEEHNRKTERRETMKVKKFNKQIKKLRMQVRSSLFAKDLSIHVHKYGEETYHEEEDEYSKVCEDCGHVNTYEKM